LAECADDESLKVNKPPSKGRHHQGQCTEEAPKAVVTVVDEKGKAECGEIRSSTEHRGRDAVELRI